MEHSKVCTCIDENLPSDFGSIRLEDEDVDEIDKDELIEDKPIPHDIIWKEISDEFDDNRRQIEEYKLSKMSECDKLMNPAVKFLEKEIFPHLIGIMEDTINKAKELECIQHQKNSFNGIDYIAERLWNLNPDYPYRKTKWTYIFDLEWVNEWLQHNPRPFYPFSWIWSREYAAIKIQSAMRGHWVRCRNNVQEMRQFWKSLAKEKEDQLSVNAKKSRVSIVKLPSES